MEKILFEGKEYQVYGVELQWEETLYHFGEDESDHTIEHSQFFLIDDVDTAYEIAQRLVRRKHNRIIGLSLYPLDENFDRISGLSYRLDGTINYIEED